MIYIFRRPDGSLWADFNRWGEVVTKLPTDTRPQILAVLDNPGDILADRVRALAERALKEFDERPPEAKTAPAPASVRERTLWGRLKWALFKA